MKIVLKTNIANCENSQKTTGKHEDNIDKPPQKNKNALNLLFGDSEEKDTEEKGPDGKHLAYRNKKDPSKQSVNLFKSRKLPIKFAQSLDQPDDPELDPQLYKYDEFVSDRDKGRPKKFKYLGFVEESKKSEGIQHDFTEKTKTYEESKDVTDNSEHSEEECVEPKESKYMSKIVSVAKKRKMERDIAFEKQLLKEELKSDAEIGEVFVTGAYKKKLEERKRFEEEQRKQDEYDEIHSKNSLTKLHTYLLNTGLAKRSSTNYNR